MFDRILGPFAYFRFGMKYVAKFRSGFSREVILDHAMDYARTSGIEGDYLEFGVFQGRTFAAASYLSRKRGLSMKLYAFDSFAGLPRNSEVDSSGYRMYEAGAYACSEADFLKNVRRTGADIERVITIPGFFEESLKLANPRLANLRKAAVVWIDCDLFSSTVCVLNFLSNYLQHGSLIIFDDYFCYRADPKAGEARAFREWLATNQEFSAVELMRFSWHGNSFVIHRKDASSSTFPMERSNNGEAQDNR
jgi:O-methyltransferase